MSEQNGQNVLVIDYSGLAADVRAKDFRLEAAPFAGLMQQMALAIGGEVRGKALVPSSDEVAKAVFEREGYQVYSVNGQHTEAVRRVAREVEDDVLDRSVRYLTLVTMDPDFADLAGRAARVKCEVRVWGLDTGTPQILRRPDYHFRPLEDLLTRDMRGLRVLVLVDYENVSIGLEQAGAVVNPQTIAEVFRQRAERHGKLIGIHAWADWGQLRQGQDVQRTLELANVKTHYEISMRGKSSSDHSMVDKAHELLPGTEAPDVLILATGDRDFRPLITTARQRFGKKVIIWANKGSVNPMVSEAADSVEWLDDFLNLPRRGMLDLISDRASQVPVGLVDPLADLVIRVEGLLRRGGWTWVSHGKVLEALTPTPGDPVARAATRDWITRAKAAQVLITTVQPNPGRVPPTVEGLTLNPQHPSVQAARLIISRVTEKIRHALEVRRMPWVAFTYVAAEMERDHDLDEAGLARTREERSRWLNLLVDAGLLMKERRAGAQPITVLWLPQARGAQPGVAVDDPELMLRRLITHAQTGMAQFGRDWAPLKTLHQQMRLFGNEVYLATVRRLTEAGAAAMQTHPNPKDPEHPTLGLHLDPTAELVAAVQQERAQVMAALVELADAGEVITPASVQSRLGDTPSTPAASLWLAVLADERMLVRQGTGYSLQRGHALLRTGTEQAQSAAAAPTQPAPAAPDPQPQEQPTGGPDTTEAIRLRELLMDLGDEDVMTITFDHFLPVYRDFGEGMTRGMKVRRLVDYASQQRQVPQLMDAIRRRAPVRMAEFAAHQRPAA